MQAGWRGRRNKRWGRHAVHRDARRARVACTVRAPHTPLTHASRPSSGRALKRRLMLRGFTCTCVGTRVDAGGDAARDVARSAFYVYTAYTVKYDILQCVSLCMTTHSISPIYTSSWQP